MPVKESKKKNLSKPSFIYQPDSHLVFETYERSAEYYDLWNKTSEKEVHAAIRQRVLTHLTGHIIEVGVGTGENLAYYNQSDIHLTAIDLSIAMLRKAQEKCSPDFLVDFQQGDASQLSTIQSNHFDCYVTFFMLCVMPKSLLPLAIHEMARVLKDNGQFVIVDIIEATDPQSKIAQTEVNEKYRVKERYHLDITNNALAEIKAHPSLQVTQTLFVHSDTYLLIQGRKAPAKADETISDNELTWTHTLFTTVQSLSHYPATLALVTLMLGVMVHQVMQALFTKDSTAYRYTPNG